LRSVMAEIERRDGDLGRQMRRAIASVALNVAEGQGSRGGNQRWMPTKPSPIPIRIPSCETWPSGNWTTSAGINSVLYSARTTASVQTSYGRSWHGMNFDGISVQATLDGAGDAYLATRNKQLFQPGVTVFVNANADIGSFHVGDTITYSYDAGLGRQTIALRVAKLTVDVNSSGAQRQKVEFI